MKISYFFKSIGLLGLIAGVSLMTQSCSEDDDVMGDAVVGQGTLSGTVVDEQSHPISGVTVLDVASAKSTTTATDGTYTLSAIPLHSEGQIVSFEKEGYETTAITLVPSKFKQSVATADISMIFANAVIKGYVYDADNGNVPLQGATVTVTSTKSAVTDANGYYEITGLAIRDYTVTYTYPGYPTVTLTILADDFVDGAVTAATTDASMGSPEMLRGITLAELRKAPRWYSNEYKGGRNADAYPMFDWACNYMGGAFTTWTGDYEEQNEGSTLRIRNDEAGKKNPADDKNFDTFVYGRKLITADNSHLTIQVRTHQPPCYWGVQIIDLSKDEPTLEYVGDIRKANETSYFNEYFDLSPWEGKEVVVIVGQYRMETGDYWHQLVLRRLAFGGEYIENDVFIWMPGTEVADLPGWRLNEENVRSMMPQDRKSYTGVSPVSGNRDNYINGYRSWNAAGHLMAFWTLMPLHKDPEVFPGEGYLIKTRGNGAVDTKEPEQYVYAKFSIAAGQNKFKLTTRNFGGNYTFFKLAAVTMDSKAHYPTPTFKGGSDATASAAADNCWKFKSGDAFCTFTYDLSEFNGQDVVICISIHNGEVNSDENKLVFNAINLE